jgi:hypothetical protein
MKAYCTFSWISGPMVTQYLLNYNTYKHLNVSGIYVLGYHKNSDSFEITKLKRPHICTSTFVQKDHHKLNANFVTNAISTLVMDSILMMIVSYRMR